MYDPDLEIILSNSAKGLGQNLGDGKYLQTGENTVEVRIASLYLALVTEIRYPVVSFRRKARSVICRGARVLSTRL